MIVCVPLFGRRVAPHFGSSSELLFYEVHHDRVQKKERMQRSFNDPMDMARKIAESEPDILVCGGIQNFCKDWLALRGITILDNQKGDAREVVARLKDAALI
ncbi:MAG: NifB/NifX family molybdenum-iron cluster-binding protein [Desulfobacterales bacterium]